MTVVHQVLSGAGPVDAVTTQARRWRACFDAWGWGGRDVAARIDPRVGSAIRPLRTLRPVEGDVLLVHHSAYAPQVAALLDSPARTLLLSHNVTPPRWFWQVEPMIAVHCALGRRQLPQLAAKADLVAGVSAFNAREAGGETVLPILLDPWPQAAPRHAHEGTRLLFVGRLTPHKRQDELIRLTALLRRHLLPGATLTLVGEPVTPRYLDELRALADELAPGAVTFEQGLTTEELRQRYAEADVLVSLSEHEGFCIPLLEAFAAEVPVVARAAGAVPETAGDAALLTGDRDPAVLAELVALAATDGELRSALRSRGRQRLAAYAPERAQAAMRAAVASLAKS